MHTVLAPASKSPSGIAGACQVAAAFFATLASHNRFVILFRIGNVKRAETCAGKVADFVAMLDRGEMTYPQK